MISSDASYPIKEFCDLLGIKHSALKKMRLDGLTVRYVGNRGYIRGADFNDWLSTQGTDAPGPPAGTRPAHLKVTG